MTWRRVVSLKTRQNSRSRARSSCCVTRFLQFTRWIVEPGDVFAPLPLSPSLWILRRRRSSRPRTSMRVTMSWMRNCSGGGRCLCHAWFTSTARSICITGSERSPRLSHRSPTNTRSRLIPWQSSFTPVFVKSRWEATRRSWPIYGCPTDHGLEKMRGPVGN